MRVCVVIVATAVGFSVCWFIKYCDNFSYLFTCGFSTDRKNLHIISLNLPLFYALHFTHLIAINCAIREEIEKVWVSHRNSNFLPLAAAQRCVWLQIASYFPGQGTFRRMLRTFCLACLKLNKVDCAKKVLTILNYLPTYQININYNCIPCKNMNFKNEFQMQLRQIKTPYFNSSCKKLSVNQSAERCGNETTASASERALSWVEHPRSLWLSLLGARSRMRIGGCDRRSSGVGHWMARQKLEQEVEIFFSYDLHFRPNARRFDRARLWLSNWTRTKDRNRNRNQKPNDWQVTRTHTHSHTHAHAHMHLDEQVSCAGTKSYFVLVLLVP